MKKLKNSLTGLFFASLLLLSAGCKQSLEDPVDDDVTTSNTTQTSDDVPTSENSGYLQFTISFGDTDIENYCQTASYTVYKNGEPIPSFSNISSSLTNDTITFANIGPLVHGSYTISVSFYADSKNGCEFTRITKDFTIEAKKTATGNHEINSDDLTSSEETFIYGIWGIEEENPENVYFVLKGTKLYILGNGEMFERSANVPADFKNITECFIDDGITTIGTNAFYNLNKLTGITGCKDVTVIKANAFNGAHLTAIPAFNNVTEIGERAFCGNDFEVIDGFEAVTTLGNAAFRNCYKLKSINGFNNLTTFTTTRSDKPFNICETVDEYEKYKPQLEEVSGFNKVTDFPFFFTFCSKLKKLSGFNSIETLNLDSFWYTTKSGSLDSRVKLEEVDGFNSLTNLDKIAVNNGSLFPLGYPRNIKTLSGFAGFTQINNATFVTFDSLETLSGFNNVTKIGEKAFQNCSKLKTLNGFASVTEIGELAFYYCSGLAELPVFENLTKIGKSAFSHCTGITKIEGFNKVTSVADYAFTECCNVTEIIGFNSLESASSKVFLCSSTKSSLKHVKGFNNLKVMVENLFDSYKLETFEGFQNVETINNGAVPYSDNTNPNFVPAKFIYYGDENDFAKITWVNCSYAPSLYHALKNNKKIECIGKQTNW